MNIHLPAIFMFTRGTRFWPTAICWWGTWSYTIQLLGYLILSHTQPDCVHFAWVPKQGPCNGLSSICLVHVIGETGFTPQLFVQKAYSKRVSENWDPKNFPINGSPINGLLYLNVNTHFFGVPVDIQFCILLHFFAPLFFCLITVFDFEFT